MTVDVERSYAVDTDCSEVWELLTNERNRAEAISVVDSFERDGDETIWQVKLPGPLSSRTMAVRTWDIETDPPRFVEFVGRSKVMDVTGEHELSDTEEGCHVRSRFVVDGKLPGVERFFRRNIDDEIRNIMETVPSTITPVDEHER
jgi:carbon monoxide dehydrogenase subunit G